MKYIFALAFSLLYFPSTQAQTWLRLEAGPAWQNGNVVRIPGDSGTKFSLSNFDTGPFNSYRIYAGTRLNERHEIRALYAPLTINVNGPFENSVDFQNQTFAAGVETRAKFKFNSYRLTYAYHFPSQGAWTWAIGFTGKIRDAEIRLQQENTVAKKGNVGFVPLLHLQGRFAVTDFTAIRFDFDGLASSQGRAIDAGLFFDGNINPSTTLFAGYRMVEGGADNKTVFNFAWVHYATLGLTQVF